jgi:pimeloyl-ACP methyl ester carboxylesterase
MRRREFLVMGGALAGAGASAPASVAMASAANAPSERPAFVLVHGAWHSATCWTDVANELRLDGHRVLAIDLPGHGIHCRYPASYFSDGQVGLAEERSPLADVTLDQAAQAVIAALKHAQGRTKPILVGHSMGGTVITRAAELAPHLIGQLVYLSAFLPTRIASPAALYTLPEARTPYDASLTVGDAGVIGAVRFNPRGSIDYLRKLQSVFYQDVSEERFLPFAMAMSPDLPLRLWTEEPKASPGGWGSLERTYIRCLQDRAVAPALQLKMIADADQLAPRHRTQIVEFASSHSPFASQVGPLTAVMRKLATG